MIIVTSKYNQLVLPTYELCFNAQTKNWDEALRVMSVILCCYASVFNDRWMFFNLFIALYSFSTDIIQQNNATE